MKNFCKIILVSTILVINFEIIACDFFTKSDNDSEEIQVWLGNNSSFSKSFKEGKL